MPYFLLIAGVFISGVCTGLLISALYGLALRRGWVDKMVGIRKLHARATPDIGGIAIAVGFVVGFGFLLAARSLLSSDVPAASTAFESGEVPAAPIVPEDGEVPFRVNAGGAQIGLADGWSTDTSTNPSPYTNASAANSTTFHNSQSITLSSSVPSGVPDSLFQSERYDRDGDEEMRWEFPVTSGQNYEVRLYFAETYAGITEAGQRVFDVVIEGATVLQNFDQYAEAGGLNIGLMKAFTTGVADGHLTVEFLRKTQNPTIKGIEILPAD